MRAEYRASWEMSKPCLYVQVPSAADPPHRAIAGEGNSMAGKACLHWGGAVEIGRQRRGEGGRGGCGGCGQGIYDWRHVGFEVDDSGLAVRTDVAFEPSFRRGLLLWEEGIFRPAEAEVGGWMKEVLAMLVVHCVRPLTSFCLCSHSNCLCCVLVLVLQYVGLSCQFYIRVLGTVTGW